MNRNEWAVTLRHGHTLEEFCEAFGGEAWWTCGLGLDSFAEVRNVSVALFQVEHGEVERGGYRNLSLARVILSRGRYFAVTGHQPKHETRTACQSDAAHPSNAS